MVDVEIKDEESEFKLDLSFFRDTIELDALNITCPIGEGVICLMGYTSDSTLLNRALFRRLGFTKEECDKALFDAVRQHAGCGNLTDEQLLNSSVRIGGFVAGFPMVENFGKSDESSVQGYFCIYEKQSNEAFDIFVRGHEQAHLLHNLNQLVLLEDAIKAEGYESRYFISELADDSIECIADVGGIYSILRAGYTLQDLCDVKRKPELKAQSYFKKL